jgi:hypothetical protein
MREEIVRDKWNGLKRGKKKVGEEKGGRNEREGKQETEENNKEYKILRPNYSTVQKSIDSLITGFIMTLVR